MHKIEMPDGWTQRDEYRWSLGTDPTAPEVSVFGMDTPYASADGQTHPDRADALRDAQTLARALTPGWVVVREGDARATNAIDVLSTILSCPPDEVIGAVKALISDCDDWRRREGEARAAKERAEAELVARERIRRMNDIKGAEITTTLRERLTAAEKREDDLRSELDAATAREEDADREIEETRTLVRQLTAERDAALLRLGRVEPPPSLARRVLRRVLG